MPAGAAAGHRLQVIDRARCRFTAEGRAVEPHSYASLARLAVTMWMNSRGHRRNRMRGRVRLTATAAAIEPGGRYCGRYWLTHDFMG
ncbi:hypothetical protein DDZ14_16000 [Maritimibacter sp. 55A14]|uniref:hypothetical protein n=1 Tax=Maritimibacter sp. 55A14 TaxID=2174844 RepID=UPI000D614474|nr:hypothetical protein [Maritimibacter sp. 55A14]PWE29944.1 hypothetical protein DDZ14_16000 [Maritimibacter sp. 55A14]